MGLLQSGHCIIFHRPGQGQGQEEGQTVVATARGVFSSAGGVLESKETGMFAYVFTSL